MGMTHILGCKYCDHISVINIDRLIQYVGMAQRSVDDVLIGWISRQQEQEYQVLSQEIADDCFTEGNLQKMMAVCFIKHLNG